MLLRHSILKNTGIWGAPGAQEYGLLADADWCVLAVGLGTAGPSVGLICKISMSHGRPCEVITYEGC